MCQMYKVPKNTMNEDNFFTIKERMCIIGTDSIQMEGWKIYEYYWIYG